MTKKDIIRMAAKAGELKCICCLPYYEEVDIEGFEGFLERFARLVAAHEREACRLIVLDNSDAEGICCTDDVLEAFRQRGEK